MAGTGFRCHQLRLRAMSTRLPLGTKRRYSGMPTVQCIGLMRPPGLFCRRCYPSMRWRCGLSIDHPGDVLRGPAELSF